nr:putative reverse transcriptase domain-containing protein [Tanacetum cinerariifolium]
MKHVRLSTPREMLRELDAQIKRRSDGALYYLDQIWVPLTGNVRTLIIDEAHKSKYLIHLGAYKIKAKHKRPSSLLQQLKIPEWKWERMAMDFVIKLARTSSGHDSIWVIMDRLTKSAHFLPMREDVKMDRLARLYLNEIVARKKGKLAPRYVGPFEITERIGPVAYQLKLPQELNGVHDTFYVSNLKKCLADLTMQIPFE